VPRFDTTLWTQLHEAQEGRQDAVTTLVERYRPPLVSYLERQGLGQADAEDLAQEVFLRFFAQDLLQEADRARGRFRSYLLAVTQHVLVDWRRRSSAHKRGGGRAQVPLEEVRHTLAQPAMDDAFDRCWLEHLLRRAMASVRQAHPGQHALLEGVAAGQTPKQLAASLGKAPGAVRVGLHRARKAFAEQVRLEVAAYCSSEEEYRDEIEQILGEAGLR
jgi:RNA polymerase sigma-70 factor (ECF subfamily)